MDFEAIRRKRRRYFYAMGGRGGGSNVIFGTLLSRTTDQSGLPATMDFDSEAYDLTGWHSSSINTTRATVPTGVEYVRVVSGIRRSNLTTIITNQKLDGADFRGQGRATGEQFANAASAIISVTPGQYIECTGSAGTAVASGATFLAVEKIDPTLKRALAYKTGTQSLSATVTATLTFDAEVYDTDAFHDNVTNNSRMTAPATGYYRVGASMVLTAASGAPTRITILKDGATTTRGLLLTDSNDDSGEVQGWTAPINFTAGQYAEAQAVCNNARTVSAGEATWLAMEEVPSTSKICLVYKTGSQALTANTPAALTWDAEEYDADGMHDNSTNNTRLTVPSGCTRARVQASIIGPNSVTRFTIYPTKNGADFSGAAAMDVNNSTSGCNPKFWTPWVDVTAGDYFECVALCTSGVTLNTNTRTWFSMECQ